MNNLKTFEEIYIDVESLKSSIEKTEYSLSLSTEYKRIKMEAGRKMASILNEKLAGRLVAFHTGTFLNKDFKTNVITSHDAIMHVEEVLYCREADGYESYPYLIKSSDRKHSTYYNISPSQKFFFVDSFIENFNKNYMGKEISFTILKEKMSRGNKTANGVPTKIDIN
jgi:hypothetical protein